MVGGFFWALGIISFVWVIYDLFTQQKRMNNVHKVLWAVGAFAFSILTAIVYYFVVKRK
mgnify:CR=1 FL=1|jgi:hypothetical protein